MTIARASAVAEWRSSWTPVDRQPNSSFSPADFDGSENREIKLRLGPHAIDFTGSGYISGFVLPNFFFHVTTAYDILRHNGLPIGKTDFLGG